MQFFSVPYSSTLICFPLFFLSLLALLSFFLQSCRSPVLCLLQSDFPYFYPVLIIPLTLLALGPQPLSIKESRPF